MEQGFKIEKQEDFFGKYEILESDIESIIDDVNEVYDLDLFDEELINKIRFVSFDSKYFYVITKGEHKNIDDLILDEKEKDDFKIYKFKMTSRKNMEKQNSHIKALKLDS